MPAIRLQPPVDTRVELQVAGVTIPVTVCHEPRRNARATIGPRGVLIRVPAADTTAACEDHVAALLKWAVRTIGRDPQRYRIRPPRTYRDGQLLTIGGDTFVLRLQSAERATNGVFLEGYDAAGSRVIRLVLGNRQSAAGQADALARMVSRGLAMAKQAELQRRTAALNLQFFRRPLGTVRYRFARSRWGSCTALGNISISTRLLLTPPLVFDYVLIHELAHLIVLRHSPRFWQLVEEAMPDYRRHQAWLHRHQEDCQF